MTGVRANPVMGDVAGLYPGGGGAVAFPGAEAVGPARAIGHEEADPLAALRGVTGALPAGADGWIGWLSYELGERIAGRRGGGVRAARDRAWPLAELWPAKRASGAGAFAACGEAWSVGEIGAAGGRAGYVAGVRTVLGHIREGDVYQVNLAHRLTAGVRGSAGALGHHLIAATRPVYGAFVASGDRAVCSLSPELFLHFDAATRRIVTRPMKGTRPMSVDAGELRDSAKDTAELTMIADLMRNDLGRICEAGSVRVRERRVIERHGTPALGGVHQAVAQVEGVVRAGVDLGGVLGAAFPPGSVTGAPKLSAMGIIGALEPAARGPFCGALGWIDGDGSFTLAVAIRTLCFTGLGGDSATLDYWAGAGIVADSDPEAEWRETLDKAAVLTSACAGEAVGL